MSFVSYPAIPRSTNIPARSVLSPGQVGTVETNSPRSGFGLPRCEGGVFQFPPDFARFTPMQGLASALYGLPYTSHAVPPGAPLFPSLPASIDATALQASLGPMDSKDISNSWRRPPVYPYDPSLASLVYPEGYASLGLAGARRKNATRETTSTLKAWLNDHRKNPYPTKGEKIMLAIISKMTLTQVSTWFANARRRLKKENRMTWSPRNRCGEERDSDDDADAGVVSSPLSGHVDTSRHSPLTKDKEEPGAQTFEMGGMAYQHYHQMVLRRLASLPPHERTMESFKQYQEQLQLRSHWRPPVISEISKSTDDRLSSSSSSHLLSSNSNSSEQHRRNSVGSPSASSHDRSPSPLHRVPYRPAAANTCSHPRSPSPKQEDSSMNVKCKMEIDQVKPNIASRTSIWSPAKQALDSSSSRKASASFENYLSSLPSSSTPYTPSTDQDKKSKRLSVGSEKNESPSRLSDSGVLPVCHKTSVSPVASSWMLNCPPFSSQHPIQHPAIAATMELIAASGKNWSHQHLLESMKRHPSYHGYQPHLSLSTSPTSNGLNKYDKMSIRHDDDDVSDQDVNTPMNLSKNLSDRNSVTISSKMDDKDRMTSIAAK